MTIFLPVQGLNKLDVIFGNQIRCKLSPAKVVIVLISCLFFSSCKYSKLVPENEYLLQRNRVKGMEESASESELVNQVRLNPNRRVLLFKAHMWVNYFGKQVGLDKIGEAPVLVDSAAISSSAENMKRYLIKKGYFDNNVTYEVNQTRIAKALKLRKQRVWYLVDEGPAYTIDSLNYVVTSDTIKRLIRANADDAVIRPGMPIDFDKMGEERSRISNLLRDNGFFYFNPSYIDYLIDTTGKGTRARVDLIIKDPDSTRHIKQEIRNVTIVFQTDTRLDDTTRNVKHKMTFVMNGMDISMAVIANNILLKEKTYFSQENLATTYERLVSLNLFSNVAVNIVEKDGDKSQIDVVVLLKPSLKYDLIWQPQFISTNQRFNNAQASRNYGLANEISLKNKNVFHNGEELDFHIRTALETQFTSDSNSAFSTFIQEFSTELKIPQLLFFRKKGNELKISSVKTNFTASYLYETNPFYRRNLFPLSYTYRFSDRNFELSYSPLLISLNQASYKPNLFNNVSNSYIQSLDRIFTNNLITSQQLGGYFTNRKEDDRRYWVIHSNFLEVAGVWLPLLTNNGDRFGVQHSTFVRTDADMRYHIHLNHRNKLVIRGFAGIGVPIGDQSVIPYERRFASGGSNYLRGWRLRTVGPGSFSAANNLQLTRTGELGLLGNLEYRFNVIEAAVDLNGALFMDAGNVWNLKADTLFPNGEFKADRFLREFAINTGLGLRLDMEFLLLRADLGIPVWDPNFKLNDRAVIRNFFDSKWFFNRPVWNIAVGYPF